MAEGAGVAGGGMNGRGGRRGRGACMAHTPPPQQIL